MNVESRRRSLSRLVRLTLRVDRNVLMNFVRCFGGTIEGCHCLIVIRLSKLRKCFSTFR